MLPARQWGLVDVVTGGAGDNVTTKGLTGSMKLLMICAVEFASELGCPWAGAKRLHKTGMGVLAFCDGGSAADSRSAC